MSFVVKYMRVHLSIYIKNHKNNSLFSNSINFWKENKILNVQRFMDKNVQRTLHIKWTMRNSVLAILE